MWQKDHEPRKLGNGIVSVRSRKTGKGSGIRVFVDVEKMLCYSDICVNKYSSISENDRTSAWCDHLKEGEVATVTANQIDLPLADLADLNLDEDTMQLVTSHSESGVLKLYEVNKSTIVTPANSISYSTQLNPTFPTQK